MCETLASRNAELKPSVQPPIYITMHTSIHSFFRFKKIVVKYRKRLPSSLVLSVQFIDI